MAGNDQAGAAWLARFLALKDIEPWDANAFIADARDPVNGKAFLDAQISEIVRVKGENIRGNGIVTSEYGHLEGSEYLRNAEIGDL